MSNRYADDWAGLCGNEQVYFVPKKRGLKKGGAAN